MSVDEYVRGGTAGDEVEGRYAFSDYMAEVLLDDRTMNGDPEKAVRLLYDRLNKTKALGIDFGRFKAIIEAEAPPDDVLLERLKREYPSRATFFMGTAAQTKAAFRVDEPEPSRRLAPLIANLMMAHSMEPAGLAERVGVLPEVIQGIKDGIVLPDVELVGLLANELRINKTQLLDATKHDQRKIVEEEGAMAAKLAGVLGSVRSRTTFSQLLIRLTGGELKSEIQEKMGEQGRRFVAEVIPYTDKITRWDEHQVASLARSLGLKESALRVFKAVGVGVDFQTVLQEASDCGITQWKAFTQRLKDRMHMTTNTDLGRQLGVDDVTIGFWLEGKSFGARQSQANGGDMSTLHALKDRFALTPSQMQELWFLARGRAELGTQEQIIQQARDSYRVIELAHAGEADQSSCRREKAAMAVKTFDALMDRSGLPLGEMAEVSGVGYDAIRGFRSDRAQQITLENAHQLSRVFYAEGSAQQKDLAMVFLGHQGHRSKEQWVSDIRHQRIALGDAIREFRESRNQSRDVFGGEALPSSTVRGWENGDIKKIENKEHIKALVELFGFRGNDAVMLERFLRGDAPEKADRLQILNQAEKGDITFGQALKTLIRDECQQSLEAFGASLDVEGRAGRKGISYGSMEKYANDKERVSKIPWAKAMANMLGFSGDAAQRFIMLAMGRVFPRAHLQALAEAHTAEPLQDEARVAGLQALLDAQQLSMVQVKEEMRTECDVPERAFRRFMKEGMIDAPMVESFMRVIGVPEDQKPQFKMLFESQVARGEEPEARINGSGKGSGLPDQ